MSEVPSDLGEPKIHSHLTDCLPEHREDCNEHKNCDICGKVVHAFNNECMKAWIEWGELEVCLDHLFEVETMEDWSYIDRSSYAELKRRAEL